MSAHYWVAKYVEDPLRNETRNVGVIVSTFDEWAARFAGERDDGTVDGRRLQSFKYADVYRQWLDYWREQIAAENIDKIVSAATPNYYVIKGGEVADTGSDGADRVCKFLYNVLVSDAPIMEVFELATEGDTERELASEVDVAFRELDILAEHPTLSVRHPIKRKQAIRGKHVTHEPSFSQRNGRLDLFEAIDFNAQKPKLLRERAGFMAYMFSDIRLALGDGMQGYSIIRPRAGEDAETVSYAREMLSGESILINWSDKNERNQFLSQRRVVAESLNPAWSPFTSMPAKSR